MSYNIYNVFHELGTEYYSVISDLTRYISKFFLDEGLGVHVTIQIESSYIYIRYKPHRDKCYILQRNAFYKRVDELCSDIGLKINFRESKCWDTWLGIGSPFYHEEKVVLVGVNNGKSKNWER